MWRAFWHKQRDDGLPLGSSELAEALRAAARLSENTEARIEYQAAADALDRAIAHVRKRGDRVTRDDLSYALGRAQLGLRDQLTELIEIVKGDRVDTQDLRGSIADLKSAMGDMFSSFGEHVAHRLADHDTEIAELRRTVGEHNESRDRSIVERRELRQEIERSKADRMAIHQELAEARSQRDDMTQALARIEASLAGRDELVAQHFAYEERIAALERRILGGGHEGIPEADG